MTDRELFRKAGKSLPFLAPPLFGVLLVGYLLQEVLPRAILSVGLTGMEDIEGIGLLGFLFLLFGGVLLLAVELAINLVSLGAYRLCLDRGEGKEGSMPWTILPQWRRYIGWAVWPTVLSVFWRLGRRLLTSLAVARLDYRQVERFFAGKAYGNVALTVFSLLVTALLFLSIRTAYLRAPERGFWRAVGFGVREGLRKWPQTIGPQLKFVVPVSLGTGLINLWLSKLALRTGGIGIPLACNLIRLLLGLAGQTWLLVFYGHLAARRYESPG